MNEDFVSYEIAKKLKDKGFEWCRVTTYNPKTKVRNNHIEPTISQVLKWLREEKHLYIRIELCKGIYFYNVFDTVEYLEDWTHKSYCIGENGNESYEESCLSAINYVLNNLI